MKNDEIVLSEEMRLELGESLAALGSGQVKLQRLLEKTEMKSAQQDAKIAQLTGENRELRAMLDKALDKIGLLTALVDGHQHAIEILSKPGGIVQ
jgi:hypothetical protein